MKSLKKMNKYYSKQMISGKKTIKKRTQTERTSKYHYQIRKEQLATEERSE